jgi:hypothetical protein
VVNDVIQAEAGAGAAAPLERQPSAEEEEEDLNAFQHRNRLELIQRDRRAIEERWGREKWFDQQSAEEELDRAKLQRHIQVDDDLMAGREPSADPTRIEPLPQEIDVAHAAAAAAVVEWEARNAARRAKAAGGDRRAIETENAMARADAAAAGGADTFGGKDWTYNSTYHRVLGSLKEQRKPGGGRDELVAAYRKAMLTARGDEGAEPEPEPERRPYEVCTLCLEQLDEKNEQPVVKCPRCSFHCHRACLEDYCENPNNQGCPSCKLPEFCDNLVNVIPGPVYTGGRGKIKKRATSTRKTRKKNKNSKKSKKSKTSKKSKKSTKSKTSKKSKKSTK